MAKYYYYRMIFNRAFIQMSINSELTKEALLEYILQWPYYKYLLHQTPFLELLQLLLRRTVLLLLLTQLLNDEQ